MNNLSFEYPDGYKALSDINLELSKGERLGVLGPNGAGKTTLILHLNGILGELKGDIKLNDISDSLSSPTTISIWRLIKFINFLEDLGYSAIDFKMHFYELVFLPVFLSIID